MNDFAAEVHWLIEHVGPLAAALDELLDDPDRMRAHAWTWQEIADELSATATGLTAAIGTDPVNRPAGRDLAGPQSADDLDEVRAAVAAVRVIVGDVISELVERVLSWALQAQVTFGDPTWTVLAVAESTARTASQIARHLTELVRTLGRLAPVLGSSG